MLKGLGQLAALMRGAGEISGKLEELTRSLESQRVFGSAGGDMVRVEMNGLSQVTAVQIDPAIFARGDREMLETLLPSAINQASLKAKELHVAAMRQLTGGIDLPGIDRMFSQLGDDSNPDLPVKPP